MSDCSLRPKLKEDFRVRDTGVLRATGKDLRPQGRRELLRSILRIMGDQLGVVKGLFWNYDKHRAFWIEAHDLALHPTPTHVSMRA